MSAHIEVIDQYLVELVEAFANGDDDAVVDRMTRIHGNYQASLNETATYHRYFTQLRDGEGGWAREMEKKNAELEAAAAALKSANAKVDTVQYQYDELQTAAGAEVKRLRKFKDQDEATITRLDAEVERLKGNLAFNLSEVERLSAENESLRGRLAIAENLAINAKWLSTEVEKLRREKSDLREYAEAQDREVERLRGRGDAPEGQENTLLYGGEVGFLRGELAAALQTIEDLRGEG